MKDGGDDEREGLPAQAAAPFRYVTPFRLGQSVYFYGFGVDAWIHDGVVVTVPTDPVDDYEISADGSLHSVSWAFIGPS